jgi:hypothetical protein
MGVEACIGSFQMRKGEHGIDHAPGSPSMRSQVQKWPKHRVKLQALEVQRLGGRIGNGDKASPVPPEKRRCNMEAASTALRHHLRGEHVVRPEWQSTLKAKVSEKTIFAAKAHDRSCSLPVSGDDESRSDSPCRPSPRVQAEGSAVQIRRDDSSRPR